MPMKTAYEVCSRYWSPQMLEPHRAGLQQVQILELPDDLIDFDKINKDKAIVIMKKASIYNSLQILRRGFAHCLNADRDDLKKELLVSCLMLIRPDSLVESEIPFFFKGFSREIDWKSSNSALFLEGRSTRDRTKILASLETFLSQKPQVKSVMDLAIQISDELYTNALYNAPFQTTPEIRVERTANIISSADQTIDFFAAFDDDQLFLGCIDSHGSLDREQLMSHLLKSYATNQVQPDLGNGGAGLGLKMIIDNSANLYIYCEKNRRTVMSCGLLLKGRKFNMAESKHLHISIAQKVD
jgi:hypothetical protein